MQCIIANYTHNTAHIVAYFYDPLHLFQKNITVMVPDPTVATLTTNDLSLALFIPLIVLLLVTLALVIALLILCFVKRRPKFTTVGTMFAPNEPCDKQVGSCIITHHTGVQAKDSVDNFACQADLIYVSDSDDEDRKSRHKKMPRAAVTTVRPDGREAVPKIHLEEAQETSKPPGNVTINLNFTGTGSSSDTSPRKITPGPVSLDRVQRTSYNMNTSSQDKPDLLPAETSESKNIGLKQNTETVNLDMLVPQVNIDRRYLNTEANASYQGTLNTGSQQMHREDQRSPDIHPQASTPKTQPTQNQKQVEDTCVGCTAEVTYNHSLQTSLREQLYNEGRISRSVSPISPAGNFLQALHDVAHGNTEIKTVTPFTVQPRPVIRDTVNLPIHSESYRFVSDRTLKTRPLANDTDFSAANRSVTRVKPKYLQPYFTSWSDYDGHQKDGSPRFEQRKRKYRVSRNKHRQQSRRSTRGRYHSVSDCSSVTSSVKYNSDIGF